MRCRREVKRDPAAQVGVSEGQTQPWPTDPQRVVCGVGEHRDVGGARLSHGSDHLHVMAARLAGEALRLALRPQEVPQRGAASGPANTLPRGANRASNATSMRVWGRQAPGRSRLGLVTWWCEPPLLNPACCRADQSGCGRGCRRPKMKYAIGTAPAELTTVTTVAHIHFGPRIWLAGRRLMSISAASLRMPSATAVMVSSLRVRWLRSLHCLLAAMPSSARTLGSLMACTLHRLAPPTATAWPSSPSCRMAPPPESPATPSLPSMRGQFTTLAAPLKEDDHAGST
jgi:hypothetical protein